MIQTHLGQPGQSLEDVCLNTYGSLDYFIKLCLDNNISTPDSDAEVAGKLFNYDDTLVINNFINVPSDGIPVIYSTKQTTPNSAPNNGGSFEEGSYDDSFEGGGM